jgi:chorismate mutase
MSGEMQVLYVMIAQQEDNFFGMLLFKTDDLLKIFENGIVRQGMAVNVIPDKYDFVVITDVDLLPVVASMDVTYRDMFHVTKLYSGVAAGGR